MIDLSQEILKKVTTIDHIRAEIKERGNNKAHATAEYEKRIAVTIIELRNGVVKELEGQKIESPPVTTIEKIARGLCWEEKLAMEEAEALYKSALVNLDSVISQMTALQSVYRHQSEV